MRSRLALVAALLVALTGCGDSGPAEHPPAQAGSDQPTWGACRTHSMQSIDYASDAPGARSPDLALAPYREAGDHVVYRPARPHRNAAWLLVDEHDVIHTAIEVWHGKRGWLVSSVDRCSD